MVRGGVVALDVATVVGLVHLRDDAFFVEDGERVATLRDGVVAPCKELGRCRYRVCLRGLLAVVRLKEQAVPGTGLKPQARTVYAQDVGFFR